MITKQWLIGALIAAAIGALAVASQWSPSSAATTVRLNAPFPAIDFAPFYVAKEKGWLAEALAATNAKPEYTGAFGEIAISIEALASDRIDLILTSETPPIVGRSAGTNLKIAWLSCTLQSDIIVPASSPLSTFADLKGKKVATLTGSSSHIWLLRNLAAAGLSAKDVQIILFSKPDDAIAAFTTGNVDALALFPPFPEQILVKGTAKVLPSPAAPIQVVLVGRGAFLQDHPQQARAVLSALEKAKMWIVNNPAEAKAIVAKETGFSQAVVDAAWPKLLWNTKLHDAPIVSDIQQKANFLKETDRIKRAVDVANELLLSKDSK
jgi:sulfonate transport system substrate-binding protein